mmetsp:Transcript_10924/g.33498  ORF Transcript_10924/g.33498 Transcript_10924/m.33498 type:complete len:229 (-) Transcript_10924:64-750(-)
MAVRGELFWEEVEIRRLLSAAQRLFEDIRVGKGGAEILREVVSASRRRLDTLKSTGGGWKQGLGNPSTATIAEYERRVREMETAYEGVRSQDSGRVVERQELLGLRKRFGNENVLPSSNNSDGQTQKGMEEVERQKRIQDELTSLLLVKVNEMKHGASELEKKIKESNDVVDRVDQLVDSNLEGVGGLRGGLRRYVRASWFQSITMWLSVAVAVVIWVLVLMFLAVAK